MTNDYPDAYKPVEGVPPPPRARSPFEKPTLEAMCENLTPAGARRVLAFMDVQKSSGQMPEHIMKRLIAKSCEDAPNVGLAEAAAVVPSQVVEERETAPTGVAGSPPSGDVLFPPADGKFPDGSRLDVDEDGKPWPL